MAEAKDLIVLAADSTIKLVAQALFQRHMALGIRRITFDAFAHPKWDPGCLGGGAAFLRPLVTEYTHAMVIFDRHGCGHEDQSRESLELQLEGQLRQVGWSDNAGVVVIDPELENWVWSDSPRVADQLGWGAAARQLRAWLLAEGLLQPGQVKPSEPKEAMKKATQKVGMQFSKAIHQSLAASVSFKRCVDPAFTKLKTLLQTWFPPGGSR